jgi:hypothetical protein
MSISNRVGAATMTPVAAVCGGLAASAAGTLAMDLVWYARYRAKGGTDPFPGWEFSASVQDWDSAPAPAQVGRRLVEGLFQCELPNSRAGLTNNIMHWGYGMVGGVPYGIVAGSLAVPRKRYGLLFGTAFWLGGYVVLPAAKLYEPIWKYDARTLANDLSAHLVYGLTTAAVFQRLCAPIRRRS